MTSGKPTISDHSDCRFRTIKPLAKELKLISQYGPASRRRQENWRTNWRNAVKQGFEDSVSMPLMADEQSIRDIEDRFNIAWNRHRPADMVESLVDDAQFVTVNGVWVKSRAAFKQLVERLHGGPLKHTIRETLELQIRFLAPDIAVVHSRFRISGDVDDEGSPISPREGMGTRVVHKLDRRWQTVAVHNTDILNRRH